MKPTLNPVEVRIVNAGEHSNHCRVAYQVTWEGASLGVLLVGSHGYWSVIPGDRDRPLPDGYVEQADAISALQVYWAAQMKGLTEH